MLICWGSALGLVVVLPADQEGFPATDGLAVAADPTGGFVVCYKFFCFGGGHFVADCFGCFDDLAGVGGGWVGVYECCCGSCFCDVYFFLHFVFSFGGRGRPSPYWGWVRGVAGVVWLIVVDCCYCSVVMSFGGDEAEVFEFHQSGS